MGLMKVAVMIAIALALSGVGALAIQTVAVQLDEGPGASSFAPGILSQSFDIGHGGG